MISRTWLQMGMPITVAICDEEADERDLAAVADWFEEVNQRFSPFLDTSEVSRLNRGELARDQLSDELTEILDLCTQTKAETGGYFDIERGGTLDPSGLVKGWAIERAAGLLADRGHRNFFVDAGGDVRTAGRNRHGEPWRVGIRNPFDRTQIVKVLAVSDMAVATSGTAARGRHIYNPLRSGPLETDLLSLTVIAPTISEADRMATAAFAMGQDGIAFIAERSGLDGYAIAADGIATYTPGFARHVR